MKDIVSIRIHPSDRLSRLQQVCIKKIEEGTYINLDKPKTSLCIDEWLDKWENEYEYGEYFISNSFEFEMFEPTEEEVEYYDFLFRRTFFKMQKKRKDLTDKDKQDVIKDYRKGMFDDTGEIMFIDDVDTDHKITVPEGKLLHWTIENNFDIAEQIFQGYLGIPEPYDFMPVIIRSISVHNPELARLCELRWQFQFTRRRPSKKVAEISAKIEKLRDSYSASKAEFILNNKEVLDALRSSLNKETVNGVKFNSRVYQHIKHNYDEIREKALEGSKPTSIDFVFRYYIENPDMLNKE